MTVLIIGALTLVALAGTAVVATDMPERQAVTLSFFGITLSVLFLALQAPDVALSQLGVGAAIVPLMVMLAIRTINARHARDEARRDGEDTGESGEEHDGSAGNRGEVRDRAGARNEAGS